MSSEHAQLQIQEVLDAFVREASVVGVQLSDRSGASLAISGDLFRVDPGRFAASLAGLLASAQGMMRPLGREQVQRLHVEAGDVEQGFAEADLMIERECKSAAVHQGYIEPQACIVSYKPNSQSTIWSSSQGQFMVRSLTATITGMATGDIKAIPAEIGGGFGGKTIVYLEPVAMILSKKCGRPVKMQNSREEVFHSTGPASGMVGSDGSHVRPTREAPARYGNMVEYEQSGRTYRVLETSEGYDERGVASWYGEKFHGRRTSSGETFDMHALSAAHRTLPLPSWVRVTNLANGRSILLRVNDRGPFADPDERILDVSYAAAIQLGMVETGTAAVRVEAVEPWQTRVARRSDG